MISGRVAECFVFQPLQVCRWGEDGAWNLIRIGALPGKSDKAREGQGAVGKAVVDVMAQSGQVKREVRMGSGRGEEP